MVWGGSQHQERPQLQDAGIGLYLCRLWSWHTCYWNRCSGNRARRTEMTATGKSQLPRRAYNYLPTLEHDFFTQGLLENTPAGSLHSSREVVMGWVWGSPGCSNWDKQTDIYHDSEVYFLLSWKKNYLFFVEIKVRELIFCIWLIPTHRNKDYECLLLINLSEGALYIEVGWREGA